MSSLSGQNPTQTNDPNHSISAHHGRAHVDLSLPYIPEDGVIEVEEEEMENFDRIWSQQANSFLDSFTEPTVLDITREPGDVMAMINTISLIYKRGIYLKMMALDHAQWRPIGRGTTFRVSGSEMAFEAVSARNNKTTEKVANRLVLKRNISERMSSSEIRSFILELRVLDHFHSHRFVVDLRGVGWFHEFDNILHPSPRPAILLEEAENTLEYLVGPEVSLSHSDMLTIFAQITAALEALHGSGIAHGDLKPGNVLLFPRNINREGIQVTSYIAKLSDFGSAVFDNGGQQPYSPGTRGYTAPEVASSKSVATFEEILRTDVWSLGMLFVVMVCGSFELLMNKSSQQNVLDHIAHMFARVHQALESSASESGFIDAVQNSIKHSLQLQPFRRRLDLIAATLSPYLEIGERNLQPDKLDSNAAGQLTISYEHFKHVSGAIKDMIVRGLELCTTLDDPRRPKAYWELGVIYLSHFADPDASKSRGLEMIRRSAEAGDQRAKSVYHLLSEAFSSPHNTADIVAPIEWLEDAVRLGSRAAVVELRKKDPSRAVWALAENAKALYHGVISEEVTNWDLSVPVSAKGDTALHRAAATGQIDQILALLRRNVEINVQNIEGDTPLLSACRFGQIDCVMLLLDMGAHASARNALGENPLHFAWCFDESESDGVVRALFKGGAALDDKAKKRVCAPGFDLLPILSGTPIERAAGRRRADLVRLFHELHNLMQPSNGSMMRRLLLWAVRLHDHDLQEFLLKCSVEQQSYDLTLCPVTHTRWLYKGQQRTFTEAACAGWISSSYNGCDVPPDFWLAALFGNLRKKVIRSSITTLSRFSNAQPQPLHGEEALINDAILWTYRESYHTAFTTLLQLKFEWNLGESFRLYDFEPLKWAMNGQNVCVIRPQQAYLIDQLFVNVDQGTLAQQALLRGDRYMFRILTKTYHANAALPAPKPQTKGSSINAGDSPSMTPFMDKLNPYSVLAYAEHRDLWFAMELRRLRIPSSCPWDCLPFHTSIPSTSTSFSHCLYSPPLLHAIGAQFWAYVYWLTDTCASLEEKVNARHDILGVVMATRCMPLISFFFRGCTDQLQGSGLLPAHYRTAGGFHVLDLFFQTRNLPVRVTDPGGAIMSTTTDCYKYLLRKYPNADNVVSTRPFYWIHSGPQMSLLHQAAEMSDSFEPTILLLLVEAWSFRQRPFPRQGWLSYIYHSPLDRFNGPAIVKVFNVAWSVNLRNICPSLFGGRSVASYFCLLCMLAGLLFEDTVIGRPEKWNAEDAIAGDHNWFDTRSVVFVLRITSFCLLLVTVAGSLTVIRVLTKSCREAFRLASRRRLWTWHMLLVLASALIPLAFGVYLSWKAIDFMLRLKVETGWWWIPYVF